MSLSPALMSSASPDWCTPLPVLNLVREFAGDKGIALDPCSNVDSIVGAKVEWCIDSGDDGLANEWTAFGLTYVNPPYGEGIIRWVSKAQRERVVNRAEIIALVPARTDARWFQQHCFSADAICFWRGRLTFLGAPSTAPFPSAAVYFGDRPCAFERVFEKAGKVVRL